MNRIVYQNGNAWIEADRDAYTVVRLNGTHGLADSAYAKTPDGLSIARARVDYLARNQNPIKAGTRAA